MRTPTKILIGCLSAPFVLVFLLLILVLVFRASPMPQGGESVSVPADPIGGVTAEMLAAEGLTTGAAPAGRAVPVTLRLEEGAFTIRQAPAGTAIRVEGNYDDALYDLTTTIERDGDGHPSYNIAFVPKYTMLRRILSQGFVDLDENDNHLTVHIPRDLPIALDATIRKGASRLFLGGLAITNARLELKMGEHRVIADEPNPIDMETLEIEAGMGEVRMEGLGLLRPGAITVAGGMGEVAVDLGDEIHRDTTLHAKMRMGEMRLGLPRRARVETRTTVWLGETSGNAKDARYDEDPDLPSLTITGGVTMGELNYRR